MPKLKKLVTKPMRIAFPKLTEPDNYQGQGKKNYSVRALVPKSDKELQKMIVDYMTAAVENSDLNAKEKQEAIKNCLKNKDHDFFVFKDGDMKSEYMGHEGHFYMNLKKGGEDKHGNLLAAPPVYYPKKQGEKVQEMPAMAVQSEVYGGCWCVFALTAFVMNNPKRGVFLKISEIMKFKDDEQFRSSAFNEMDFDIPEEENDDEETF